MNYKPILAAFLCFLPSLLRAEPASDSRKAQQEAVSIVDLIHDLQFEKALSAAAELEVHYPHIPSGAFFKSVAYYQRYLLEDPPSEPTLQRFEAENRLTLKLARKMKSSDAAISEYYQGAALGFQARVHVAQKHYALAIPEAREGVAHLRKALELDPSLQDANLGLGMYYYFMDRIPVAAKPFTYLMVGMWGDRSKGLQLLRTTAERGQTARMEAQSVLASIDASEMERNWDEALRLLREMMTRYPHNPRYRLKIAYVLERQGLWEKAADMADPDGAWIQDIEPTFKEKARDVALYRSAETQLFSGHASEAGVRLEHLAARPMSPALRDWVYLRQGNYWDSLGQPAKARLFYSAIRHVKARGLAKMFLQTPFPAGPRDVMPSRWPLSSLPE